ncbi:MAG: ATP-binding cassette domain-containing protein [Betaproteobacteria bacterium]|nr:ATP-binding cassette domain-containing protein [Betaproteobacteria bacterium]
MTPVVDARALLQRFGVLALEFPDWHVSLREQWLVIGPSGSGKSTLLALLAGLRRPSAGRVAIGGQDLAALSGAALDRFRGRHIGFVPQQPHLVATLTLRDNVELARYLAGLPRDPARVAAVLARLGLAGRADHRPHQLSRGEAQRAAVARALVNRPALLLADEPTAHLDDAACAETLDLLLHQAGEDGAALVLATHDGRVKARFSHRLALGGVASAPPAP